MVWLIKLMVCLTINKWTDIGNLLCTKQWNLSFCLEVGNPINGKATTWKLKGQLDSTVWFLYCKTYCSLNMFRAPLCPSSGAQELHRWLLSVVLGALVYKSLVWCGVEGYVLEQHPANRTHNPQFHTRPTTCKPKRQVPQAATICITLELLMMGIMVPETCWADNMFCNKEISLFHLVGLLISTY